jgi:signal peptidase I
MVLVSAGVGVALVVALWWIRARFVLVTVEGPSMEPEYRDGDRLLVRRTRSGIRVGAVVVGERAAGQHGWIVKRVAAVAGDAVPAEVRAAVPAGTVPPGTVVLLGTNPAHSNDSRAFGWYPVDQLVGVAVRKLLRPAPPDRANRSRWSLEKGMRQANR